MRPGCCSRVGSAEEHQLLLGAQSRVSAAFPRLCALHGPAARPAPPARPRDSSPARLPPASRPPPAIQTGCAGRHRRLPRLARGEHAAELATPRSLREPYAARPSPSHARDGSWRRPARHAGSCSPRRAAPPGSRGPRGSEEAGGLCLDPDPQSLGVRTWGRAPPPHRWRGIWSPRPDPSRVQQRPGATPRRTLKRLFQAEASRVERI